MAIPPRELENRPWWKRKRLLALLLLLLLGGGAACYLLRPDPVGRIKQMQEELRGEAGRQLSPEERREKRQHLREEIEKLTPEQRNELFADRRKAMKERLDHFFGLSPDEQVAEMDRQIQRSEQRRRDWEARAAGRNSLGARGSFGSPVGDGGRGPGRSPASGSDRTGDRSSTSDAGSSGQSASPDASGGGANPPLTRDQRRKLFIDSTTPVERAQMNLYAQMLRDRRQQLGLPPTPPRFGLR